MTTIPPVLTLSQLCALLSLAPRTVYGHRQRHDHPAIVELPRFGRGHVRFSGQAVADWLSGGPRAVRRRPRGKSFYSGERARL